ncbi:MAG TPA: integrase arm-type DNA-binding domain-containing protein [Vulgatibacter sp.]
MALTVREIEAARPGEKVRRLYDAAGLYLEIRPTGSRLWMLKYRVGGKEKRLSLGPYPEVTLREARERTEDERRRLREGVDPSAHRQAQRQAAAAGDSLEVVSREWFIRWSRDKAESHHSRVWRALERDVFPKIGKRPLADLEPTDLLPVLRAVEDRGAVDTTHRIRHSLSMIFRYGVATGRCRRDQTADLRGAIAPAVEGHLAAVTEPDDFGALLRALEVYRGSHVTGWALRLAPLLVVRPGELRHAEWEEIDLEAGTWTIPAAKMKMKRDHIVPLARQAVAILREATTVTGKGRYVFPGVRTASRPISDNTLTAALRRLGFRSDEATAHGFRASFRTLGAEVLGFRAELMEHQLAHEVKDPLGRAYNRAEFLPERRVMMQRWADWCDEAKATPPSDARSTA